MGVKHLEELRVYLKKNKSKVFTQTQLRDHFNNDIKVIKENLIYLIEIEKSVKRLIKDNLICYKWKE